MERFEQVPLPHPNELPPGEMRLRARAFSEEMSRRRTVRHFSDRPVSREIIEDCLRAAGAAPSGANMQPWHFVVVSHPEVKRKIREGAEAEERAFYEGRASDEWLEALAPLGTDASKPFLESAPYLIAVFARTFGVLPDGRRIKHYYVQESVGISVGILVAALHHAGLVSLTHTPSPMGFLNKILGRPANERPYLLLITGHPAADAMVPRIGRKPLQEIATFI